MKLSEIPVWEKPREKVIDNGIETLTTTELIAILLRFGTRNKSVLELSSEVLKYIDSLEELKNLTVEELLGIDGIGIAKATTIVAAIELGKRISSSKLTKNRMLSPKDVFNKYSPLFSNLNQEHVYALYLDTKGHLITQKLISIGNINSSLIDDKIIFKWAYKLSATAFILIHNHPSGDCTPSVNDLNATKKLIQIANDLGFVFLDHIIIGTDYYSMKIHHSFFK